MKKHIAILLVLCLLTVIFAGCSANTSGMKDAYTENEFYMESPSYSGTDHPEGISGDATSGDLPTGRKWIVNMYISAETEDLTLLLQQVGEQVAALGGYTEQQSTSGGTTYSGYRSRYANLTLRIPADKADAFLAGMSEISNVTSSSKELSDVTLTYVATESRVKALETEEARLLELLAQAENLSDILAIEDRLTDVRYELESVTSTLRVLDNKVDYATIDLSLSEVKVYTPAAERTFWQRIRDGFTENLRDVGYFLEDLVVWFLSSIPSILLICLVAVPLVFLISRARKRRKAAKKAKEQ